MSLRHTAWHAAPERAGDHVLGGVAIGNAPQAPSAAPWPEQHLKAPLLLGDVPLLRECWHSDGDGPWLRGERDGLRWCRHGGLLYGVIELDDAGAPDGGSAPLQATSQALYGRIFDLLREQGTPHLWRVWNYLARINDESHGLERYRQFNLGRYGAFVQAQRETGGQVPAACAIGVAAGPLSVAFLAGTSPVVAVENPRQLSAWQYPSQYGPRAPTFSRAALAYPNGQEVLFISGTASIVGHATLHAGDVVAQCEETVRNLDATVQAANRLARSALPFTLQGLSHRVYVRHARDAGAVQRTLRALLGDAPVVHVQADICRADLLVEIESQAIHALAPTP